MSYISQNVNDYTNRFANLRMHILYSLGYPLTRVELTEQHIDIAIIDALTRYYDRAAYDLDMRIVPVGADNVVPIPQDINPIKIENVIFNASVVDSFTRGMFVAGTEDALGKYVLPQYSWNNLLDQFDMVGYYLFLKRMEDFKDLVGIERHWEILNGKIYLFPVDAELEQIGIVYRRVESDTEVETNVWIKDWALAKAKHMLGTIRSKMSGFTTAGGNIAADGDALKTEAKEEMTALLEQLNGLQKPLPLLQF